MEKARIKIGHFEKKNQSELDLESRFAAEIRYRFHPRFKLKVRARELVAAARPGRYPVADFDADWGRSGLLGLVHKATPFTQPSYLRLYNQTQPRYVAPERPLRCRSRGDDTPTAPIPVWDDVDEYGANSVFPRMQYALKQRVPDRRFKHEYNQIGRNA